MKKENKSLEITFGDGAALVFVMTDFLKDLGVEKKKALEISYNFYEEAIKIGRKKVKVSKAKANLEKIAELKRKAFEGK